MDWNNFLAYITGPQLAVNIMSIPLPKIWPKHVKTGILHAIALARMAFSAARGQAIRTRKAHVHLASDLAEAHREIALLEEEIRLKDLRMERVPARHRPFYRPVERLAILELRTARGWSRRQTARRFHVKTATVSGWMSRIDEDGAKSLLQPPKPVNRLPDYIRHIVRRLKVLCPTMGKKRLAQTLARAGLVLGVNTVARMLKERERPEPAAGAVTDSASSTKGGGKPVQATKPNDSWHYPARRITPRLDRRVVRGASKGARAAWSTRSNRASISFA